MSPSFAPHTSSLRLPHGFGVGGFIPLTISASDFEIPDCYAAPQNPEDFMLRAVIEGMRGVGQTNPNPAVGCLLTSPEGKIVACGHTEPWGSRHAERVAFDALRAAGLSSQGLDAFVTLEPCAHFGRQPPCCQLFENAGIRNLYASIMDPNPSVEGKGILFVKNQTQGVHVGLARHAATAWHLPFLAQQRLQRPIIIAKWAQTLDGAFADSMGQSQWITGPQSRAHGHWLRLKYDVTVVGLSTLLTDRPSLTVRDCWRPNDRQPDVCIVDALGEAQLDDAQLNEAMSHLIQAANNRKAALITTAENLKKNEQRGLTPTSFDVLSLPHSAPVGSHSEVIARSLVEFWSSTTFEQWLGRPAQSIFIEGGPRLISLLMENDALDLLHVFIAPLILGGRARRLNRESYQDPPMPSALHFDVLSTLSMGDDMLLELMPKRMVTAFFSEV